jgi:hypothetical protein
MRFKFLFVLLLFFEFLNGFNSIILSQKLKPIICNNDSMVSCNANSYFVPIDKYIMLDNDKLIIFFTPFNPNSSPYKYGNINAIVVFDFKAYPIVVSKRLSGNINVIKRDTYGGIWVSHPWTIEGETPALSYTMNGLDWKDIILPNVKSSSVGWLKICLLPNEIALRLRGNRKENFWKTSYREALSNNPYWKSISKEEFDNIHCLNADVVHNNWKRLLHKNNSLTFSHGRNILTIPKKIPIINQFSNKYSIQIGHFKLRDNLEQVSRELNEIIGYSLISKEISPNSYKLFLGTFDTQREAKDALNRLKRKYRKNIYINEAFIVKLEK